MRSARLNWTIRPILTLTLCMVALAGMTGCSRAPDISTPKKAAATFAKAMETGDMDTMKKSATGTDAQFASLKTMSDVIQSAKRYRDAVKDKFGEQPKSAEAMDMDMTAHIDGSEEKIDGDKATLVSKDGKGFGDGMKLKKDSDGWKVDLAAIENESAGMDKMATPLIAAFDGTTKDIKDGKYKTAKEASDGMTKQMMGALMGAH